MKSFRISVLLLSILALGALIFSPATPVAADESSTEASFDNIEYVYDRFLLFADGVQLRLDGDVAQAEFWQSEIDLWTALDHDTTELQAALDIFVASIPEGQALLDQGLEVMTAEDNGFDETGEVTDLLTARLTLRQAYPLLLGADRSSRDAQYAYRDILLDWRVETFELTGENVSDFNIERLELLLQESLLYADGVALRIPQAEERAEGWEAQIDGYEEQGFDVASLREALAAYEAAIPTTQSDLDAANVILTDPAGYDENGAVVDPLVARDTLREAYPLLQAADRGLRDAKFAYEDALLNWRVENLIEDAE
ncbi:MAG: hypothetical protein GYB68_01915 [Chloroflexi bacterium]|nr:hypothetical protein [Chloroflexota bacterium]